MNRETLLTYVCFFSLKRKFTANRAQELNITGWVRNRSDEKASLRLHIYGRLFIPNPKALNQQSFWSLITPRLHHTLPLNHLKRLSD